MILSAGYHPGLGCFSQGLVVGEGPVKGVAGDHAKSAAGQRAHYHAPDRTLRKAVMVKQ